jgi:hypothetical protein
MKLFFSSFSILFSLQVFAQNFSLTPTATISGTNTDFELVAKGRIVNLSSDSVFRWVRTSKTLASGWESSVCDTNACYFPETDSAVVIIQPGRSSKLDIYFYPEGVAGSGEVEVKLFLLANRNVFLTGQYSAIAEVNAIGSFSPKIPEIKIYPNPATDFIVLESKNQISTLEWFDSQGRMVQISLVEGSISHVSTGGLKPGFYNILLKNKGRWVGRSTIILK